MQIKAITVNAAGMTAAGRGLPGNNLAAANQAQAENGSGFGPECRVTISREGKSLSRRQAAQAETNARGTQSVKDEKRLLRQQEQIRLSEEIRDNYREKLNDIEKEIEEYNTSYARFDRSRPHSNGAMLDKTIEEREKLKTTLENQKKLQAEESQRLAKEARQMAMQSAGYQDEIDENNRDLATLLKTMEEAEKAEEEREGEAAAEGSGAGTGAAGTGNSVSDVIQNSATHFMTSSTNRERSIEEMMDGLEASGRWYVDTADSITRSVLQRSAGIKAALDAPEDFTDEQITEMMEDFQSGIRKSLDDVRDFRSFGLEVLRDTRDLRIKHTADNPLRDLQKTKDSMAQFAADAVLGGARQNGLDEASRELAEEVEQLIDERNDIDGVHREEEEEKKEKEEQTKEPEEEQEQAEMPAMN